MQFRILIVDDEEVIRNSISLYLRREGYLVDVCATGEEGLRRIEELSPDLLLLDVKLPKLGGLDVLKRAKELKDDLIVIMITAYGSVESAVQAMKAGAYDYITKPLDLDELDVIIKKGLETVGLKKEVSLLRKERLDRFNVEYVAADSPAMREVEEKIEKIAQYDSATVLIQGESGTGKELVATSIHYKSPRANKTFVVVNCATIPKELVESELFGYESGAFTGAARQGKLGKLEMAEGGTLFFDEIGELDLAAQGKLLRFLETREFERIGSTKPPRKIEVRVLAATNKRLSDLVNVGAFRLDLYHRLNVMSIVVPPLRERTADILKLAKHFVSHNNRQFGKHINGFTPEAQQALLSYSWPGNVRELKNIIERAVFLCEGEVITRDDLAIELTSDPSSGVPNVSPSGDEVVLPLDLVVKRYIHEVLEKTGGNKSQAARLLGITRKTLRERLERG
ncbi:MAG TPA: sigma-54 dependent transcriptional regulator [Alphaproteobacteria bacterium]|nr:sigma-54 dependent transcriptional regulator [Alphaproteobacteria bacterium]